jgi:hypothetical protein
LSLPMRPAVSRVSVAMRFLLIFVLWRYLKAVTG